MLRKVRTYLFFLWKSTNQHGVHSPFIYDFVTKCLYAKSKPGVFSVFLQNKKQLLANRQKVEVQDFGAGSKIFKSSTRQISDIVKVAGISNKRGKLLLKIVSYFQFNTILEIGTSVGIATVALSLGNKKSNIVTLEGCKNTADVARNQFQKLNLQNIELIVDSFESSLEKVTKGNTYDLIYFDGNHTKEATLKYFNICLETIHNESVFIFDDIFWNQEMSECWEEIKKHPLVTVTINTYTWGIVFFRAEQAKEHFTIRV
jgi:predicted O-methyltransferase YrrM